MSGAAIAIFVFLAILLLFLLAYILLDDDTSAEQTTLPASTVPASTVPIGTVPASTVPPVPVVGPNYSFYAGMDSHGTDLLLKKDMSISDLQIACDANSSCAGFNSNGWLKSSIAPKDQWKSYPAPYGGLYVKN